MIGPPSAAMTWSVTGLSGTRIPTLPVPATRMSGTASRFGQTTVSGPGVKTCSSLRAASPRCASCSAHLDAGDRDVHRVAWAAHLDRESAADRVGIERGGAEQIPGLGREHDEASAAKMEHDGVEVGEAEQAIRGERWDRSGSRAGEYAMRRARVQRLGDASARSDQDARASAGFAAPGRARIA